MDFVEDYLNFMDKWNSIRNDRVVFIRYEDFLNKDKVLVNTISVFLNRKPTQINMSFDKVKCSTRFTPKQKKDS